MSWRRCGPRSVPPTATPSGGGDGADPQRVGAAGGLAARPRRHGADGASRAVRGPAKYYNKHTKTDRLDCQLLARLPLLHPDGLVSTPGLGPAEALRRTVGHRESLITRRTAALQRLDALLELLGPAWIAVLGTEPGKAAL